MSEAFLVEVDDTDSGVQRPTIVGPFPDDATAYAFAEKYDMGTAAQSGQGGYSAVHVVSAGHSETPEAYAKDWLDSNWDGLDEEARAKYS